MSYYIIVLKILEIADECPHLIDFYWPQLVHVHLVESGWFVILKRRERERERRQGRRERERDME